jgi:hypothetical protein
MRRMLPPEHLYHDAINTLSVGIVLTQMILEANHATSMTL